MNRFLLSWWIKTEPSHLLGFTVQQIFNLTARDVVFELVKQATRYYLYLSYREEAPFIAYSTEFPPSDIFAGSLIDTTGFVKAANHQLTSSKLQQINMPYPELRLINLVFEHLSEYGVKTEKQIIAELAGRASQIALISPKGFVISYAKQVNKPLPGGRKFVTGKPFPIPEVPSKPLAPSFGLPALIDNSNQPVVAKEWLLGFSGWDRELALRVLNFHGIEPNLRLADNPQVLAELKIIVQSLHEDPARVWMYYTTEQDITANELVWTWLSQRYKDKEIKADTVLSPPKRKAVSSPVQALLRKYGVSVNEYSLVDGYLAVRGNSDKANDELVRRLHSGEHIWFHAHDYPGSHVVLILDKKQPYPSEKVIRQAALIAGYYSKANPKGKLGQDAQHNVEVVMCPIKLLKRFKNAKPGQVLIPKQHRIISVNLSEFAELKKSWYFTDSNQNEFEDEE